MAKHSASEQDFPREQRDEQGPKTIWGHSLAAAGVCLGAGTAIALIAIIGQPG